MGIKRTKFYYLKRLNSFDFMVSQGFWKQKKDTLNNVFNRYLLGLKCGFMFFRSDLFLEYISRCAIFCFNLILEKTSILFLIPYVSNDEIEIAYELKELILYFCLRSLQPYYFREDIRKLLVNKYVKNTCFILLFYTDVYNFFIKEALNRLIPIICLEDSNDVLKRGFYSILGNSYSVYFLSLCYKNISNSIIKAMLLSYFVLN